MTSPTPISRCEFGVLLLICLLGFGFRAWDVSSVGIDHFDEGVYALSGLSLIEPEWDLYFKQTEFSPPLFFTLVGLSYRMAGQPSGEAAIAVNVVLGALTIPLLWWVGRIWFGAPAGIFAAALLAFSEYHITLSRAARQPSLACGWDAGRLAGTVVTPGLLSPLGRLCAGTPLSIIRMPGFCSLLRSRLA